MDKVPPSLQDQAFEVLFKIHIKNCRTLCKNLIDTSILPWPVYFSHKNGLANGTLLTVQFPCGTNSTILKLQDGSITAPTFFGLPNRLTLHTITSLTLKFDSDCSLTLSEFNGCISANEYDARILSQIALF